MLNRLSDIAERARANQIPLRRGSMFLEEEALLSETSPLLDDISGSSSGLQRFLGIASEAQSYISALAKTIQSLRGAVGRVVIVTSTTEKSSLKSEIDDLTVSATRGIRESKQALIRLEEAANESDEDGDLHRRMRVNVYRSLLKRLDGLSRLFLTTQEELTEQSRERGVRGLMISAQLPQSEAAALFESGLTADNAMSMRLNVSAESASSEGLTEQQVLMSRLTAVAEQLRAVRGLEKNMEIVRQLMVELAVLVDRQGEMIDSIEWDMVNTKNFSKEAAKALEAASRGQRNKLMFWAWCVGIFLSLLGVIVVVKVLLG